MVNVTEVETGEKTKLVKTETENEEEIRKGKKEEKQTDMREIEIEIPAGRGEKGGSTRAGIENEKRQKTGKETRNENDEKKKTETDWIKKIKILTKMKEREVIDMTRIQIEGRSAQKMR